MNNNRRWRPGSYMSFIFSFFQTIFFPYSALVFFSVCVCACTWYKYDVIQKGEKRRKIGVKSAVSTHFQSRPMSKNNPHHCFSALIPVFVWKCSVSFFVFFLQAHSFHPLVASLALWTSLVGSREKSEGEGTRCRCPTAADWRMCRGARLMLYKTKTTSLCWAATRSQKRQLKELKPLWSECRAHPWLMFTLLLPSVSVLKLFMLPSVIRCPSPPTLICQVKA